MSPPARRLAFFGALFAGWAALAAAGVLPAEFFPSPATVGERFWTGAVDGEFLGAIGRSVHRLLIGYAISTAVGIPLGLTCARIPAIDQTVGSLVVGLQALPSICWLPAALLWFGPTEPAILFVVVMGSVLSIAVGANDAARNIPSLYLRAARTMGTREWRVYREVIFPAALPGIVTALKQGWLFAWRSLMGAELIVAAPGLGRLLQAGRSENDIGLVAAVMVVVMGLGWSVDKWVFATLSIRLRRVRGLTD